MFLIGNSDSPELFGTRHNDVLIAGNDSNFLYGGLGHDILIGRGYFTSMTGGAGADWFSPDTSFDASTFIADFQHGVDKIIVPKTGHAHVVGELLYVNGHVVGDVETNGHAAHVTQSDFLFV